MKGINKLSIFKFKDLISTFAVLNCQIEFKEQKWTTLSPCPGRELFGWRPAATAHPSGSCQPSSSGPEKTKQNSLIFYW